MGKKIVYHNKAGQEREFTFDDDVEEVDIVGDNEADYLVAIGQRDGENQVVNGIDEVIEEP